VTKLHLHRAGLVTPARSRSAHRKKRPRRPMVGMMLHQDASTHTWLPGDECRYDMVATMDDATSAIYSLFLVAQEGTASSLRGVREVIEAHGLFCSLYTDRGSHYFEAAAAGARVSKTVLTQFGRALKQLGIEHIPAYSPQARGRSERLFGTLQDRLPKELALAGITTLEAANRWLRDVYIADHNARFAVPARAGRLGLRRRSNRRIAGHPVHPERPQGEQRQHGEEWRRLSLQLPPSRLRPHFVKATVRVHEYPDDLLAVFWGPHLLAHYDAGGRIIHQLPARPLCAEHAPAQSMNEADRSRATETGQIDQLATLPGGGCAMATGVLAAAAAPFGHFFANSVVYAVVCTLSVVTTSLKAGSVFGKYWFPPRGFLFGLVLSTAIAPFEAYMIPLYLQLIAFGIFLMRQLVSSAIPNELMEAARMVDPASRDRATVGESASRSGDPRIQPGVGDADLAAPDCQRTVAVSTWSFGLTTFQFAFSNNTGKLMAGSVVSGVPMLIVFPLMRRRIIENMALTELKG
jgi:hypothetical protein